MPIIVDSSARTFHLTDGEQFSYILQIGMDPAGGETVYQLYWGAAVADGALDYLAGEGQRGLASFDSDLQLPAFAYPTSGRGDFRPAALRAIGPDGTDCTMLHYQGYAITPGKPKLPGLPAVYVEDAAEADTLTPVSYTHLTLPTKA